ncbi:MAG TPA: hypothetical protein VHB48_07850 [Chitinophagaceae bacterium]|nr:hypothetical protein [Chitinophagaceae bacterium]
MKKTPTGIYAALVMLLIYNYADAQKLISVKGQYGLYYKSITGIEKQQKNELAFFGFIKGDTIGSIGAQACNREATYAALSDSLFFYLEDIDTTYCNTKQARAAWQYYSLLKGTPLNSGYAIITGDEKTTHLPTASCNKILIINSFHEFTYPAEMLHDISTKLKPGGILFIDEAMARYSGELHPACKKRMYLQQQLISLLAANGFAYKNSLVLAYHKNKPARQVFAFTAVNK